MSSEGVIDGGWVRRDAEALVKDMSEGRRIRSMVIVILVEPTAEDAQLALERDGPPPEGKDLIVGKIRVALEQTDHAAIMTRIVQRDLIPTIIGAGKQMLMEELTGGVMEN